MEYDTWLVSHFHYLNAIKKPQNVQLLDLFCILLLSQNKSYTTVYWNKCKLHHATSSSQPLDFHFQSGSPKHEFTHCSLWNFRCSHYASAGKGIMPLTSIRKTGQISFERKHNNRRLVTKTTFELALWVNKNNSQLFMETKKLDTLVLTTIL